MKELYKRNTIDFIEKNIRGSWVIYGEIGIKQYYYYTKAQAIKLYKEEVKQFS